MLVSDDQLQVLYFAYQEEGSATMTDSQRKHKWREQTDADGDKYKSCTRKGCYAIWSHMHDQNSPEPVGCTGEGN